MKRDREGWGGLGRPGDREGWGEVERAEEGWGEMGGMGRGGEGWGC